MTIDIDRLTLRLPPGYEARATQVARRVAHSLGELPTSGRRQIAHLNAGRMSAWGWAAHRQGGAWRRLAYMIGTDRDAMFDVRAQIIEELQNDHASA